MNPSHKSDVHPFEIFYNRKQHEQLTILADYVIANHFPHLADGLDKYELKGYALTSSVHQPPLLGGALPAALYSASHFTGYFNKGASMKQRTFLTISLSLNLILFAFVLGGWTGPNVLTSFNPDIERPTIAKSAFVHQLAAVTGNVTLGERMYVAPFASIRGDEE